MSGVGNTTSQYARIGESSGLLTGPQNYDMTDTDEDLKRWPLLCDALQSCREINEAYDKADQAAILNEKMHWRLTLVCGVSGTIAVLLAIMQLAVISGTALLSWTEFAAASVAIFAVIFGVRTARHRSWLLERHKAEACRLLKFRFLSDPSLWEKPARNIDAWIKDISYELSAIATLTTDSQRQWVEGSEEHEEPALRTNLQIGDPVIHQLVDYYRRKRVDKQLQYFSSAGRKNFEQNLATRSWPKYLFFGSVLFVFVHVVWHSIQRLFPEFASENHGEFITKTTLVLAASLPAIAAGIRAWRMAHEFAPRAASSRANYVALLGFRESLNKVADPEIIFRTFYRCERQLISQHREWLRLMIEAEWFG